MRPFVVALLVVSVLSALTYVCMEVTKYGVIVPAVRGEHFGPAGR